ncbi:50S ribosomal protein L3 [candidate division KSB1 bacterium]|nr:50S ribosomal protein L3 [candidate division KSB1 bacterium]
MIGLLGKKVGMTRIFDPQGKCWAVSVIEVGPCFVSQIKTKDSDNYDAIQLGFKKTRQKLNTKPLQGHLEKAGIPPVKILKEVRDFDGADKLKPGDEIKVDIFSEGDVVAVSGVSKGKGFAGVVKRHGFGGGPKTHGQSDRYRAPGSIGQSSSPSRIFKGIRMAGRMGGKNVTVKNIRVEKVDAKNNLLILRGAVPGANGGTVFIKKA